MHLGTLYCIPFVFDMNVKNMNSYKIFSQSKLDNSRTLRHLHNATTQAEGKR
jgi:hypothetical protein